MVPPKILETGLLRVLDQSGLQSGAVCLREKNRRKNKGSKRSARYGVANSNPALRRLRQEATLCYVEKNRREEDKAAVERGGERGKRMRTLSD